MGKVRTASSDKKLSQKKVVDFARKYLEPHQPTGYRLIVGDEAELQPDGFWYVFIHPTQSDVRAYDYDGRIAEATVDMQQAEDVNVLMLDFKPPNDD